MRTKDPGKLREIERFVCNFSERNGYSPSLPEIADGVGVSKATAYRYVARLCEEGIFSQAGSRSVTAAKDRRETFCRVPLLGQIACGIPKYAEENIEEYIPLPVSLFGPDECFLLRAYGDSMIGAGIEDGDLVLIRRQNAAEAGQIVVALTENEATLKRYYPEPARHRVRLHPENPDMTDIVVARCDVQGVAIKVLKDLH